MRTIPFVLILIAVGCTPKTDSPKLYVNQTTFFQMPSGAIGNKDSLFAFSDQYFDISLTSYPNGKYGAQKRLTETQKVSILWMVVDSLKNELQFSGTTEFLNFMSKRGYEPTKQLDNKYGADYTFKKK